jgi:hypothetical protein
MQKTKPATKKSQRSRKSASKPVEPKKQPDYSNPTDEQIAVLLKIGKMLHG